MQDRRRIVDDPRSMDRYSLAQLGSAAQHHSMHPVVPGVAINGSDELVRGQVKRAQRLVRHVYWQELDVRGLFAVRPAMQIFAPPDRPNQGTPLLVFQAFQLANYF